MSTASATSRSVTPRYYKTTLSGLTYRELWNFCPWWALPIMGVLKICGSSMLLGQGVAEPAHLDRMRIDPTGISDDLLAALNAMVDQVGELGFGKPIYYRLPDSLIPDNEPAAAICPHEGGETFANLIAVKSSEGIKSVGSFITGFADGSFFSSGNDKKYFTHDPRDGVLALPRATVPKVFLRHESARQQWSLGKMVRRVSNEAELAGALFDYELRGHQWHVGRGVYLEMTPEEVAAARRQFESAQGSWGFGLEELSLRADLCHENAPEKVPQVFTYTGVVVAEAVRAVAASNSNWLLVFSTPTGTTQLDLTFQGSLLGAVEGEVYKATLKRVSGSSGKALLEGVERLLGEELCEYVSSSKELRVRMTFVSRAGSSAATETKSAGEHIFRMELPSVPGAIRFTVHPAISEVRLKPDPELDRSAALRSLASLLN